LGVLRKKNLNKEHGILVQPLSKPISRHWGGAVMVSGFGLRTMWVAKSRHGYLAVTYKIEEEEEDNIFLMCEGYNFCVTFSCFFT
jgi:hypothetical protein